MPLDSVTNISFTNTTCIVSQGVWVRHQSGPWVCSTRCCSRKWVWEAAQMQTFPFVLLSLQRIFSAISFHEKHRQNANILPLHFASSLTRTQWNTCLNYNWLHKMNHLMGNSIPGPDANHADTQQTDLHFLSKMIWWSTGTVWPWI